jgi:transposase
MTAIILLFALSALIGFALGTSFSWLAIAASSIGIAAYCRPENKIALGFVEGLNNKIRVFQRRAYGLRDEEYLKLKILTASLPEP